jgi:hypothetical protein
MPLVVFLVFLSATSAFAQQQAPFFSPGNLVVAVEGCGVHGGTCTNVLNGTGPGGSYGDNQAAPLTLFQYAPNGTSSISFVNSLVLPQAGSGANLPIAGEYGSSSEASIQLSGAGQYLTIMGYGVNADTFNASPTTYGSAQALAQSGSLTGQTYTAVPRVLIMIDANGNVNSATGVYNVFNTNNPRSGITQNGVSGYISGQGVDGDATQGVFYLPSLGVVNNAPVAITGLDATDSSGNLISQDTRILQILNNTLYVSVDTKGGKNSARSFIGTLGTPPATGLFNSAAGPTQLVGFGTSKTGKLTITSGTNSNGNNLNNLSATTRAINLSPVNYFLASPSVLYVADSGFPKNDSNGDDNSSGKANIGDGGLQKWINSKSDGTGTWSLAYTLYQGLNLVNNGGTSGTTGLYGLAGVVSGNNVQLYATNYTIGDLDQTNLYGITDTLSNTTPPGTSLGFTLLEAAPAGSNFKGISFAPTIPAGDVEVTSVPSGISIASSGTGCAPASYNTPQTLTWTPGSSCTLTAPSSVPISTGVQYGFEQWEDGTTNTSHVVTAPASTATYTATYATQYQLTTSATTGGTVSAGGFFAAGSTATITATPNSGFYFVNFTGATTSTNNPLLLTMNSPQSVTANFAPQTSQTITCSVQPPSSAAYNTSFTVACTASSNLAVVYTSGGSCSNAGPTYTMTSGTGTCSVFVNQAGGGQYSAAPQVSYSVAATLASQTIVFTTNAPATAEYGSSFTVAATGGGSGNPVVFTSAGSCSNTGATYTMTSATGTCSVIANQAGDGVNYAAASQVTQSTLAANANATVTVTSGGSPSVYGQSVTFTATISSDTGLVKGRTNKNGVKRLDVSGTVAWSANTGCGTTTVTSGSPGVATCTTSTVPVGTNTITATYSGDNNHGGGTGTLSGGQVVNTATTTLSVTSVSPSSEVYGANSPVTITAVLSWTGTGSAPTATAVSISGNGPSSYGATSCGAPSGTTITCMATYTPTSADQVGSYTESAAFAGDGNYALSNSTQTNNFTIAQASAGTVVTSSLNPSAFGQSVTFTATISGENNLVKGRVGSNGVKRQDVSGTVAWSANTGCGTTAVTSGNPGIATCTTSSLALGTNSITATYSGDGNHGGSSGSLSQVVNRATTTVALGSTPNPSSFEQSVTFTATLTPQAGGQATGTVNFKDGSTTVGTSVVSGNTATFHTNILAAGSHSITAVYGGDPNFSGSTSNLVSQVVNQATTTVTLISSANPAVVNQNVTFTATVAGQNGGTATGTVSFAQNGSVIGTATVINGQATLGKAFGSANTKSITATYSGDANFAASTSAVLNEVIVTKFTTTTALVSNPNPSIVGQSVTFTATVSSASGTPTGTVTFMQNGSSIGSATLGGGQATFSKEFDSANSKSITAVYSGDASFSTSSSSALSQMVNKATTTTVLVSSPDPSAVGQSVTIKAAVTPQFGGSPSGTITFIQNGSTIGTATLSGGQATLSKVFGSAGAKALSATYSGDTNFTTSTGSTTQTVQPPPQ